MALAGGSPGSHVGTVVRLGSGPLSNGRDGVAVRFQLVVDCTEPERLAHFWAAALGYVVDPPPSGFASGDDYRRGFGLPESHARPRRHRIRHQLTAAERADDDVRDPAASANWSGLLGRQHRCRHQ
jgi:hypothetical protein